MTTKPMIDADGDVIGENLDPRARGRLRIIGRDGVARIVAETCGKCGELALVGQPHSHRRAPPAPLDVKVEGHAGADVAEAFWKAIALLAAETLDDGDLAGEDLSPGEEAA